MELSTYNTPNVLFLKGCFIQDCLTIEQMYNNKILQSIEPVIDYEETIYDKIPETFSCIECWKKNTNLKCWHCDFNFDNTPIFIPNNVYPSIDPNKKFGSIEVLGNFCSFNCAGKYINTMFIDPEERWEKQNNLKFLYTIFHGKKSFQIPFSPPKTEMLQYGGKLSKKEYKQSINELNKKASRIIINNDIDKIRLKN